MSEFDQQKQAWEQQRQQEVERLQVASQKLIDGWKQLEDEKREWLARRELKTSKSK